jgi:hypothetical protein
MKAMVSLEALAQPIESLARPIEVSEPEPPLCTPRGTPRVIAVNVLGSRDWVSTGLIVTKGDRVCVSAAGQVVLNPAAGQVSGPDGIDLYDRRKLMGSHLTGALIGVIGADNDDFIFIGRSREFVASRSGLLFLSVNEGNLSDNVGSFRAAVMIDR